mmetsp:Transcript_13084/g.37668  ORF Transcript_13084/g.37668 Transcript_13084/m.37668 type:complete len:184 (+) Transcript_13084:73-624(+)
MTEWEPGQQVLVTGLSGARHLNSLPAKVLAFDEEKGRYAVHFSSDGQKRLLKGENLSALAPADEAALRAVFSSEPATPKLQRLLADGELGFAEYDDEHLRRLVRRLLEAGYWADNVEVMDDIGVCLNLAEHPSGPEAIALIRQLEAAEDLNAAIMRVGAAVHADAGLKEVFDQLRARGHEFDF